MACECLISELKVGGRGGRRKSSKEEAKMVFLFQLTGSVVIWGEGRGGERGEEGGRRERGRREEGKGGGRGERGINLVCLKHETP